MDKMIRLTKTGLKLFPWAKDHPLDLSRGFLSANTEILADNWQEIKAMFDLGILEFEIDTKEEAELMMTRIRLMNATNNPERTDPPKT